MKKTMKKGFSLVELVIVLAIIAVLTAMVTLAWNNYIYSQKLRASNSASKVIFNAAQAECIKFSTAERTMENKDKLMGDSHFFAYWDGNNGFVGNNETKLDADSRANSIFRTVNNLMEEPGAYKIWIQNYQVQSVAYAPTERSKYIGTYPVLADDYSTYRFVSSFDMSTID